VFAQAREKARQITCASNLKQIGLAIAMYRDDYEHYVPEVSGGLGWFSTDGTPDLLSPYFRASAGRQCPSRKNPLGRYCINGWLPPETSPAGFPDSEVPRPAGTLIVWEHQIAAVNCFTGQGGGGVVPDPQAGIDHWDSAHHGGFVSLWCDGHVKRMSFGQLRRSYFSIEEDPD